MVRLRQNDPRKIAERLFLSLHEIPDDELIEKGTIEVLYPERFGTGKALVVIAVPYMHLSLGTAQECLNTLRDSPYPPLVDGNRRQLVLFVPCPNLASQELDKLVAFAHRQKEWARKIFRFKNAVVRPDGPRINLLIRRRAI